MISLVVRDPYAWWIGRPTDNPVSADPDVADQSVRLRAADAISWSAVSRAVLAAVDAARQPLDELLPSTVQVEVGDDELSDADVRVVVAWLSGEPVQGELGRDVFNGRHRLFACAQAGVAVALQSPALLGLPTVLAEQCPRLFAALESDLAVVHASWDEAPAELVARNDVFIANLNSAGTWVAAGRRRTSR